jgi:hypothetical protein
VTTSGFRIRHKRTLVNKIDEPFDGDPPDKLVDETADGLDKALEKMKRWQAALGSLGVSSVVILSTHDPLTGMCHISHSYRGNYYQNIGALTTVLSRANNPE